MASNSDPQLAQVTLHPALIIIGSLLVSVLAKQTWHLDLAPWTLTALRYVGIAFRVAGIAVLLMSYGAMVSARTTIDPRQHSAKLVTSGLYAYSRNPIYVGWFLLIAGIGLRNASGFVLAVAVTMIALLYRAVVVEEEAYLEKRFGDEYLSYKKRVRRWL